MQKRSISLILIICLLMQIVVSGTVSADIVNKEKTDMNMAVTSSNIMDMQNNISTPSAILGGEIFGATETPETPANFFTFNTANGTITGYENTGPKDVVIPKIIGEVVVKAIGERAFQSKDLTNVIIPNSVTSIGKYAFGYNKLTSIDIPEGIISVSDGAFSSNELTDISLPDSLISIGYGAFYKNKLISIKIPEGVTSIDSQAFMKNELADILLPNSLTNIGSDAFNDNELTDISLPDSLTSISSSAFRSNKLTRIEIPEEVTRIEQYAFYDNMLTSIKIPEGLTKIDQYAFYDNELTDISLPNSLKIIGKKAFYNNHIKTVTIPEIVETIGEDAFFNNDLEKVVVLNEDTFIPREGFIKHSPYINLLGFKDSTTHKYAIENELNFSEICKVEYKSEEELVYEELIFGTDSKIIPPSDISEGRILVGWYKDKEFTDKWNFETDIVSESITLYAKWTEETKYTDVKHFDYRVYNDYIEIYGYKTSGPKDVVIASEIEGKPVKIINMFAFFEKGLTSVIIPDTVTMIVTRSFENNKLTAVSLSDKVETIGNLAFAFNKIKEIELPESLKELSGFNNNLLTSITIPNGVSSIGKDAFASNILTQIDIPTNVKSIGENAFSYNHIRNINLTEGLKTIGKGAFNGNDIAGVNLPDSLSDIGESAFAYNELEVVVLPENLISVKDKAFTHNEIDTVYVMNDNTVITGDPFAGNKSGLTLYGGEKTKSYAQNYGYNYKPFDILTFDLGYNDIQLSRKIVNGKIKPISDPIRDGYEFAGWYKDIEFLNPWFETDEVSEGLTLYAKWVERSPATPVEYFYFNSGTVTGYSDNGPKDVVIPLFIDGQAVVEIGESAFQNKQLISVVIPETVREIERYAFKNNRLTNVIIPDSVLEIGVDAFSDNELSEIKLSKNIKVINSNVFARNHLTNVNIPEGVTSIESGAFNTNQLTEIKIPSSVLEIKTAAFAINPLINVSIPENVNEFDPLAIMFNPLKELIIYNPDLIFVVAEGMPDIYKYVDLTIYGFDNSSAKNYANSNKYDFKYLFNVSFETNGGSIENNELALQDSTINEPVEPIKEYSTFLGWYKEEACINLWDFDEDVVTGNITLYAKWQDGITPTDIKYFEHEIVEEEGLNGIMITNYSNYGPKDVIIPEIIENLPVISIGEIAFEGKGLDSVTLPDSLLLIRPLAFNNNELKNITIPEGVKEIYYGAFANNKLTNVIIPESIEFISKGMILKRNISYDIFIGAFANNKLTNVTLNYGVKNIGINAFSNNNLSIINIPDSVVNIASGAFAYNKLSSLIIPDSVIMLGDDYAGESALGAFSNNSLTNVKLSENLEEIYGFTFAFNQLESIEIPESVSVIGLGAFYNNKLTSLVLHENIAQVYEEAFGRNQLSEVEIYNKDITIEQNAFKNSPYKQLTIYAYPGTEYAEQYASYYGCNYLNFFTLTYTAGDNGTVIGELNQLVKQGQSSTEILAVPSEGYHYARWSDGVETENRIDDNVNEDINVTAEFAINEYIVNFIDFDEKVLKTEAVEHGSSATAPQDPTREGYTFKVWDKEFSVITSDLNVTAQYDINEYTVNFIDFDGTIIKTETIQHGSSATAPQEPNREGYTFKVWDKDYDVIISDLDITAIYEQIADSGDDNSQEPGDDAEPETPGETGGSGGSGSGESNPVPEKDNSVIIVNGIEGKAGNETITEKDGEKTVSFRADSNVLNQIIDKIAKENEVSNENGNNVLEINMKNRNANKIENIITGDIIQKMEQNHFTLSIATDNVEYVIPVKGINIEKVATELNTKLENTTNIEVKIEIKSLNDQQAAEIKEIGNKQGYGIIVQPMEFKITAKVKLESGEEKETTISKFSNYVSRVIEIPENIDPSKVTTGIVYNIDGTFSHIPTTVFSKDGRWYARINSLTNSTYTLIENNVEVSSLANHWSKDYVNDLASRLILKNHESFKPDDLINRGEFAEYITKALGIYRTGTAKVKKFTDVEIINELSDAITIAAEYGIIAGYPDGTFKPNAYINREEAMTMYARAMDIVKLKEIDNDKISSYADSSSVSDWAYNSVKKTVSAGVFNGRTIDTIDPKGSFTYAEAATAIRNLLMASNLINK